MQAPTPFLNTKDLEVEIQRGKSLQYDMPIARLDDTWLAVEQELKWYIDHLDPPTDSNAAMHVKDRLAQLAKFSQISFAHGSDVQTLAVSFRIHHQLRRYISFDSDRAYSALSNLVTKNGDVVVEVASSVLRDKAPANLIVLISVIADNACHPPLASVLFLRNAIAACRSEDAQQICELLSNSLLLLQCFARLVNVRFKIMPTTSESDEALRELLVTHIMRKLLEMSLIVPWLSGFADAQYHALETQHQAQVLALQVEVLRHINDYWGEDTKREASSLCLVPCMIEALKCWSSYIFTIDHSSCQTQLKQETPFFHVWKGIGYILSSLKEILAGDKLAVAPSEGLLEDVVPSIVSVLGYARKHFPRPTGGRVDPESTSITTWVHLRYLKRNCITILANLSFENRRVQDEVRRLGGLPLVLEQCQIDEMNPHIMEHAVYCMRCLMTGNSANQELIEQMRAVGVEQAPQLVELDLRADLNVAGAPKLSRISRVEEENDNNT